MSDEEGEEIWQVSVVGMESGVHTINVAKDEEEFKKTTVIEFRRLIKSKWSHVSTGADDLRLLFAGKQLADRLPSGKITTYGVTPPSSWGSDYLEDKIRNPHRSLRREYQDLQNWKRYTICPISLSSSRLQSPIPLRASATRMTSRESRCRVDTQSTPTPSQPGAGA